MDKRLKDYYDGLFSPEEESEVQKWLALHGKDESVSDSLRELFDGEEKRSGEQTLMYKRIAPEKKSIWRSSLMAACIGVNVKSRLIKLVLLPLWYGNKDIIRDTLS